MAINLFWPLAINLTVLIIDIFIVLPLSIIKKTRGIAFICLICSSLIYGITIWLLSLYFSYIYLGLIAVIAGSIFLGIGVIPIAIFAAGTRGEIFLIIFLVSLSVISTISTAITFWYAQLNFGKSTHQEPKINKRAM
ncbi:hypothetical protein ACFLZV_04730 [Candidatus Margulisiibacteriota bacterium]